MSYSLLNRAIVPNTVQLCMLSSKPLKIIETSHIFFSDTYYVPIVCNFIRPRLIESE